jgi:hypothetical protein
VQPSAPSPVRASEEESAAPEPEQANPAPALDVVAVSADDAPRAAPAMPEEKQAAAPRPISIMDLLGEAISSAPQCSC